MAGGWRSGWFGKGKGKSSTADHSQTPEQDEHSPQEPRHSSASQGPHVSPIVDHSPQQRRASCSSRLPVGNPTADHRSIDDRSPYQEHSIGDIGSSSVRGRTPDHSDVGGRSLVDPRICLTIVDGVLEPDDKIGRMLLKIFETRWYPEGGNWASLPESAIEKHGRDPGPYALFTTTHSTTDEEGNVVPVCQKAKEIAEVVEGRLETATEDVGEGQTPTAVDEAKIYYDAVNGLSKKQRVYGIGTCGKTYYSDSYRSTASSSYPSFDAFQKMKGEMEQSMMRLMEEKLREEREIIRREEREIIRRDERDSIRQEEIQRIFQEQMQQWMNNPQNPHFPGGSGGFGDGGS